VLLAASGVGIACSPGPEKVAEAVNRSTHALELPGPIVQTAPLGRIEDGTSGVNALGAFQYNLPIRVPEGISGVTPTISISYSSQAGNGPLGVGFSLHAASVIRRCKRTVSTHGVATSLSDASGVLLDSGPFCLDGMPLVPLSKDEDGTITFATEADDLSHITYTTHLGLPRFTVRKGDGRVLEYGSVASVFRAPETTGTRYNVAFHLTEEHFPGRGSISYSYEAETNLDGTVDDWNAARTLTEIRYAGRDATGSQIPLFTIPDGRPRVLRGRFQRGEHEAARPHRNLSPCPENRRRL
jgi:hypothetical protein